MLNNIIEQILFPLNDLEPTLNNGDTITLCRTMTEIAQWIGTILSSVNNGKAFASDIILHKSQAPEHLINFLLNHFIRELGSDNVVSVLSFCKHLRQSLGCNDEYLERIESHCLRLILQFVNSGKANSIRDLRDRKDLHSEILFHATEGSLMQAQLSTNHHSLLSGAICH